MIRPNALYRASIPGARREPKGDAGTERALASPCPARDGRVGGSAPGWTHDTAGSPRPSTRSPISSTRFRFWPRFAGRRSSSWSAGISRSDRYLLVLGLLAAPWLNRHGRVFLAILGIGYAIRAVIWICGGNLPLVPGDSCHYLEVATSVLRGEGPVKHYVESFFRDYPRIRDGQGVLDDWATPLDAYVRASAFRIAGLGPESPVQARLFAAKACSFVINLLALPALYVFARRRYGCRVAIWTMAVLAILPVHAIYAGFVLRESLVALDVDSGGLDADRGFARRSQPASDLGLDRGGRAVRGPGHPVAHDRTGACWRPPGSSPSSCTAEEGSARSCSGVPSPPSSASPGPGRRCRNMERRSIHIRVTSNTTSPGQSTITRKATRSPPSFTRWKTCPRSCGSRSSR